MKQESSLIMTKLNIPTISSKLVKRPRLFNKLDDYFEYRLTLVTAAAGYGKTTLVTSWLEEKQNNKLIITWFSVDEDDNDPEWFWSYFLISIYRKILNKDDIRESVEKLYQNTTAFNKLYFSHFINIITKLEEEILIVVDDFNIISNDRIIEDMKFLIKNMPSNMHIFILGRNLPELGLTRLRAADSVLEINQQDLYFTAEETLQFFDKVSGTKLPCDKCNLIWNEAEGWVAGIQMMALAIKNSNRKSLDDYVYKNNVFVFDYMAEEVFLNLNDGIKKFLLYTSILSEFSPEICNYLLDIKNSIDIIEEIEGANLFLMCIDREYNWFRYHNLFGSFLKKHLDYLGIETVHKLYDKAAQWYECNKQIDKAIENYIKGLNFKRAARLIEQVSGEILCRGEAKLLNKWNQILPKAIVNVNPRLIMNNAWAALSDGRVNEVWECITMAEGCERIYPELKDEIVALRSTNISGINDVDIIIEECKNTLQSLEPKQFLTQLITFNMARAYLLKGEVIKAIHYSEKCLSISIETGESYISIVSNRVLLTWKKFQGKHRQAEQKCIELISKLKINGDIVFPVAGILYAELSDIYYQWNELEKSMEMAKEGLKLGIEGEDIWTAVENYFMLAKIYNAMNLDKEYIDVINKIEKHLKENQFLDTRVKLEGYKAELMIRKKEIMLVSKWLSDISPLIKDDLIIIYPEVFIVKVKLFIYENEIDKARKILNFLEENAEKHEAFCLLMKVKVLNSMIYDKLGFMKRAFSELEKAVELGWKQKAIRFFLDEGSWMENMLRKLRNNIACDSKEDMARYIDVLLVDFKQVLNTRIEETEEILSKREIEILQFIGEGATNSEISSKLFISINTVKTHLLNIYTKLDVHSRTRAVAKAKKLKLI